MRLPIEPLSVDDAVPAAFHNVVDMVGQRTPSPSALSRDEQLQRRTDRRHYRASGEIVRKGYGIAFVRAGLVLRQPVQGISRWSPLIAEQWRIGDVWPPHPGWQH